MLTLGGSDSFLEDEIPFAPTSGPAEDGERHDQNGPGDWWQRWRVVVTIAFVAVIAAAIALAFDNQTNRSGQGDATGSARGTREAQPLFGSDQSGSSAPDDGAAPAGKGEVEATARTPVVAEPPSTSLPPPSSLPSSALPSSGPVPASASTASVSTATGGPATSQAAVSSGPPSTVTRASALPGAAPAPRQAATAPGPTTPTTRTPATPAPTAKTATTKTATTKSATTRAQTTTTKAQTTKPPVATTTPAYATGSTQFRSGNEPPFVVNPGQIRSVVGRAERYQLGASWLPGETITFSATGLPDGLSLAGTTGLVTGTPTREQTNSVQVTATSSNGSRFTQGFTWVVQA